MNLSAGILLRTHAYFLALPFLVVGTSSASAQSTNACITQGNTLAEAQNTYTAHCSSPRADCDPVGSQWYCSSETINANNLINVVSALASTSTQSATNSLHNNCASADSDTDGDGYGWENNTSCIVVKGATTHNNQNNNIPQTAAATPVTRPAATIDSPTNHPDAGQTNGVPICLSDSNTANGYGYENNRSCKVVAGVTATRLQPLLQQRLCTPWMELSYGDHYVLQNNTWNSNATYQQNWSQCIELSRSRGDYIASWDYNWLNRTQGEEYAVKSYPQVYYGRKTSYNQSGTPGETGLPANINNLPSIQVDFKYSETGNAERNVALESFLHTSCEAEDYNKHFEMMVWVGRPSVRTPGSPVTTANIDGITWDVYTNPQLSWGYVAFVARQPLTQGSLNWNAFIEWSRHQGPAYGVPPTGNNTCLGAVEIGTETFWGTGTFNLEKFNVQVR